jgi:hypothetical protein
MTGAYLCLSRLMHQCSRMMYRGFGISGSEDESRPFKRSTCSVRVLVNLLRIPSPNSP